MKMHHTSGMFFSCHLLRAMIVLFSLVATGENALAAHPSEDGAAGDLAIVTGHKSGTYIAFGRDIARIGAQDGLNIRVVESGGSIDNINRITSKEKVGLAIVQSDVLGFLSRSKSPESIAIAKKLRLVAPLYSEEVHVLARNDIKALADLSGKRVVVGSEGSGSMITAMNIFGMLGIKPGNVYEDDPAKGVVAVLNNQADAMVFVGGKPVKMFQNMEALAHIKDGPNAGKLDQVHFVPVNEAKLLKEYRPATLTPHDYAYITQDVPTVAVTAVLVSYDYTMKNEAYYHQQCQNMAKLAHALREHIAELKAGGHPKWNEVDLNADVGIWKRDTCSAEALSAAAPGESGNDKSGLEKDLLGLVRGKAE